MKHKYSSSSTIQTLLMKTPIPSYIRNPIDLFGSYKFKNFSLSLPLPYPYPLRKNRSDLPFTPYGTSPTKMMQFLLYSGKLSNVCIYSAETLHVEYVNDVPRVFFKNPKNNLNEFIRKCEKPFIVIRLGIDVGNDGHANTLIVNKTTLPWSIERFDPNGSPSEYDEDRFGNLVRVTDSMLKQMFWNFDYIGPVDTCPNIGIQTFAEKVNEGNDLLTGFCQTWSVWYSILRLLNAEVPPADIVNDLLMMEPRLLYNVMQDFYYFVKTTATEP